MQDDVVTVFQCVCDLPKHQMTVRYSAPIWRSEDRTKWWEPELWISVCLSPGLSWYKRLWIGILYALGLDPPRWDPFETTILKPADAAALKQSIETYLEQSAEFERRCYVLVGGDSGGTE